MKKTLVVVVALACFKAYKVDGEHLGRSPRLELIEDYRVPEAQSRLVDKVSDQSGRFPRGTGMKAAGAMSDGERHNIELEARKRLIRMLADRLNALARGDDVERCFLAASREINRPLIEALDPLVRGKVLKNVPADLTKIQQVEILGHF